MFELCSTHRDGAGGVSVWVVCPAHVVSLVPGAEVGDHEAHAPRVLVIPGLPPLVPGLERVTSPGPLDGGRGEAGDLTHEHGLASLLHPQTLERAHPLGRPPGDPSKHQYNNTGGEQITKIIYSLVVQLLMIPIEQ